jgi:uncharacterized membrane protein
MTTAIRDSVPGSRAAAEPSLMSVTRSGERAAAERRARGLGWFSIGLGLAQIAAPRTLSRIIGLPDGDSSRNALFVIGLREIGSGVGLLRNPRSPGWLWTRAAGDAMDLALLAGSLRDGEADRSRLAAATMAVAGVAYLDVLTGEQLSRSAGAGEDTIARGKDIVRAVTIGRPREEVYGFWRDFTNLPRFMEHLESVEILDDRRSHWKSKGPAGSSVEWDAELTGDRPGELIAWRSLEGSEVANTGTVRFLDAPGGRGTEVRVSLTYAPPAGAIGTAVARLFGEDPGLQVTRDLGRFKQVMELGEVIWSDASIHGRPHPAQPPAKPM